MFSDLYIISSYINDDCINLCYHLVTLYQAPRKPRSASRSITISANSNKRGTSSSGEIVTSVHSEPVVNDGWASANDEVSTGFSTGVASPPLPPIGTPAMGTDANSGRRSPALKYVNLLGYSLVCIENLFRFILF